MSYILSDGWKISAIMKFSIQKNTRMYDVRCPPWFIQVNKGRSPYNGRLSDFSFYIDSQTSVHRKFKKRSIDNLETQKKYISMKNSQFFNYSLYAKLK